MTTILALALLLQSPADDAFRSAQDRLAAHSLAAADPPRWRDLVDLMGAPRCSLRDAAQDELRRLVAEDRRNEPRILLGLRHRDPEVRIRSGAVARRIAACHACLGRAGRISIGEMGRPWWIPCGPCDGHGVHLESFPWLSGETR